MTEPNIVCIDREFYERAYPGTGFEEARAILIGMYLEKELESAKQQQLKIHLDKCACCTQFLGELEKIGEFKSATDPVPYAACPSSEDMDIFLFDHGALLLQKAEAIAAHVKECPLCKEEVDWLQNLERGKVIEYRDANAARTSIRKDVLSQVAAIAAVFFFLLSAFFWWQNSRSNLPVAQLKALAHLKEPNEINFANLAQTASPLDSENERLYNEGVQFFKDGNFRDAGARFEDVLIKKPDHSASLFLLGYCYYKLDQMEKAFALCNRAESMHPHSLERCMSLVNMALITGHYDRAIEEINSLYHAAPQVTEVNQMYHEIMRLTHGRTVKL
jgi:tetratricopeptide (TPR) repeat protein